MFRIIRALILVLVAFVAGLLFERSEARTACEDAGGVMQGGICRGVAR